MPLVFASITPHSPLLIPTIGRENVTQLAKTLSSLQTLKEDLYVARADSLIIISPHGANKNNSFTINLSPEYSANLEQFGDHSTRATYTGDIGLIHQIRENLEDKVPMQLITENQLDYGCFIPLLTLTNPANTPKLIPIYDCERDVKSHFEFGQFLQREIAFSNKRIAVIASADLSHKLNKNSPAGYSPNAEKFDTKLLEYLNKNQVADIMQFKPELLEEVAECGLRSIATLLGILSGTKSEPDKLSYESPFGVGCLTLRYHL